ncbi:MAG: hypothetical protein AAFZ04_13775 [Pseudomonadota bacterium]
MAACRKLSDDAFARFVYIFFDSWVFRLERKILRLAGKDSTRRADVIDLASEEADHLAAWITLDRSPTELLLAVPDTPILTWLQVARSEGVICLRFGSGILPQPGKDHPHWGFRATYWAHRAYSRILLHAARADWVRGKTLPT